MSSSKIETELSNTDYKQILNSYDRSIPKSKRLLKQKAEKVLATKLCRCIKKVYKTDEGRAIGICTKSVINKKGLIRGRFTCKGKASITLKKKVNKTTKTRKNKNKNI